MEEERLDVNEVDSSTTEDVNEEESSIPEDVNEEESSAPKHEEAVPYDRFKEANENAKYWQEQALRFAEMQKMQPSQSTQPQQDPYAGMDAQTRVFYQDLEQRTQAQISRALGEKEREYQATIEALSTKIAQQEERAFRQQFKDVVPGSQEEQEIAGLIKIGVPPERAAWAVMGERWAGQKQQAKQVKQQVKTQQKAQANLETSSIPQNSGLPNPETMSFRDRMDRQMKAAGF